MVDETQDLILYGSLGCHLCELAEEMLISVRSDFMKVEITDDEALVEAYGVHIPVLKRDWDEMELFWPFDREQLLDFLKK